MPDLFTILEYTAVCAGLLCVYLQTKENIWAWPFGIVSVAIYVYIFYMSNLVSDTVLNIIYIFMNAYGWYFWSTVKESESLKPITVLDGSKVVVWFLAVTIGTIIWGLTMSNFTKTDLPYPDAFTTVGSLIAQYLLARKILQNWLLWIIVDIVAIVIYIYKGLYPTAGMFFVFLLLCIKGYFDWYSHAAKK